jgi:hypothetical protein
LSDLDEDDMAQFWSGLLRMLPLRDQAGRLVLFYANSLFPRNWTLLNRVRNFIYRHFLGTSFLFQGCLTFVHVVTIS